MLDSCSLVRSNRTCLLLAPQLVPGDLMTAGVLVQQDYYFPARSLERTTKVPCAMLRLKATSSIV